MVGKGVLSPPSAAQCWLLMAGVEFLPAMQVSCRSASSDKEIGCSPVYNKVICKKLCFVMTPCFYNSNYPEKGCWWDVQPRGSGFLVPLSALVHQTVPCGNE